MIHSDEKQAQDQDKREDAPESIKGRPIFYVIMTGLWLLLLPLALETCERGRLWLGERMYARQFDAQNARVYGMKIAEDVAATLTQWRNAMDSGKTTDHPMRNKDYPDARNPMSDSAEIIKEREMFAAESEENLNTIYTLEGKLVMRFTRDGRYLSSHGAPALERGMFILGADHPPEDGTWVPIMVAVKNVVNREELEVQRFHGPLAFYRVEVTPLHASDGRINEVEVVAEDITHTKTLEERCNGSVPPDDSRWEIPFFSLKKNWSRPNEFLSSNNVGFRDHDVVLPKPKGVYRIVCVGGSTTEEGNSVDHTYPNVLERKLRAWFKTDRIEVVNCGIMGVNSYIIRQRIQDYLALDPDLILYYGPVNDITHLNFPVWLEQTRFWQERLGKSKFLSRWLNHKFLPPEETLASYLNATTYRNLRALNYAAREKGAEMAIISFAWPTIAPWNIIARNFYDINLREVWASQGILTFASYCSVMALHNRLIQQVCRDEDMTYIPLAEEFRSGTESFFDICHMTPHGMDIKTDIIGKYVAQHLMQTNKFQMEESAG